MTKISLELDDIKALASDSRLEILKALDGKKLSLNNISEITKLNKATLHVHLSKLLEAEFIKKNEREGHKWVYYKLTWKGECLLHPENTRIVVLFSITFISFFVGVIQLLNFAKGTIVGFAQTLPNAETTQIFAVPKGFNTALFSQQAFQNVAEVPTHNQTLVQLSQAINSNANVKDLMGNAFSDDKIQWSATPHSSNLVASVQDPTLLYIGLVCFAVFIIFLCVALWRLWENKTPEL
ncbi:MAG: winged helix-turn-helix domain-containing protein [Euryarchaeota archaeon]|nr:winged helix-turn-helix domain-containing protein [Euryarchaeota archaeon]